MGEALVEMLRGVEGRRFLDVGCGGGGFSRLLLEHGWDGVGIDPSPAAVERASPRLRPFIDAGRYKLMQAGLEDDPPVGDGFDAALSLFVIEHVEDDVGFLGCLKAKARPGGRVVVAAPGRKVKWSLLDDTAGHLRRYDRADLVRVFQQSGMPNPAVWSIGIPTCNLLFGLSKLATARSERRGKPGLSKAEQTQTSGVRDIPFKTVFPPFFRVVLNRTTLWPLLAAQRLFYNTGLGMTMLAGAQRDA